LPVFGNYLKTVILSEAKGLAFEKEILRCATLRMIAKQSVLNFGNLDFEFVSDFNIRISNLT